MSLLLSLRGREVRRQEVEGPELPGSELPSSQSDVAINCGRAEVDKGAVVGNLGACVIRMDTWSRDTVKSWKALSDAGRSSQRSSWA